MKKNKKIQIEHLQYEVFQTIHFDDFSQFMKSMHKTTSAANLFYALSSILFFALTLYYISNGHTAILNGLVYAGIGLVIAILLLPIHELIHFAVFKLMGAKEIRILPYFKKFYFLTIADQFIIRKKNIFWIASMPFIVISSVCSGLLFVAPDIWQIIICACLLYHTSFCLHDFQIIGYFYSQNNDIIIKADIEKRHTEFFKPTV